jgi:DNA polymerase-3 subunit chi
MTEILFYRLQRQPIRRVLPMLLEKLPERGWRVIVRTTMRSKKSL